MIAKHLLILSCVFIVNLFYSQNEFISIWKPSNPSNQVFNNATLSTDTQIWIPVRGTNFKIYWEEIGFPSHNGTLNNVTADYNLLINFGTAQTPEGKYRVKISNGNGTFKNIQFASNTNGYHCGDFQKILEIEQWGNIQWQTMEYAYTDCSNLNITATDIPNLNNVTSMKRMFSACSNLIFNPSINNWNTSNVTNFEEVFFKCSLFNQPLHGWNTSNVTITHNMFGFASTFNQYIGNWNVSKVVNMEGMFAGTTLFNQNISNWNLNALQAAYNMFTLSGLDCDNYTGILNGWSTNAATPNNVYLGSAYPLVYNNATGRTTLLSKSWYIQGDVYNANCGNREELGTSDVTKNTSISFYPNPTTDFIYVKNLPQQATFAILDISGRLVLGNQTLDSNQIDVRNLTSGSYFLQITSKEKTTSFKFVKK